MNNFVRTLLLLLLCCVTTARAESYSTLWKSYAEYVNDDKPQSAMAVLRTIEQKAERGKSYGNLLKAVLAERGMAEEVSHDSLLAVQRRLEDRYLVYQSTDGVMATMLRIAMTDKLGTPRVDSLLASPDAGKYIRKNSATDYKPYVEQAVDSKYFADNLLSLIAMETNQQRALYDYYRTTADRKAACIAGALLLDEDYSQALADSLVSAYGDLPECGAVAVRCANHLRHGEVKVLMDFIDMALQRWPQWKEMNSIRNMRRQMTAAKCYITFNQQALCTDTDVMMYFNGVRNVKGVKVRLTRKDEGAVGGIGGVREYTKTFGWQNEYDTMNDSLSLGRLPLGEWTVSVEDVDHKLQSEEEVLRVSDLRLISLAMPSNKVRHVVVNAITGQPVGGAMLHIQPLRGSQNEREYTTDDKGEIVLSKDDSRGYVRVTAADDTAMARQRLNSGAYNYTASKGKELVDIYTDRSIYRPGQTVSASLIAYKVDANQEMSTVNGDTLRVALHNAQGKEIEQKTVVTDDYGTASVAFQLPEGQRSGAWSIRTAQSSASIRVEEYKRPTFDVTLKQPTTDYHNGDTLRVKGVAMQYNGIPVAGAQVAYSIDRRRARWWRWDKMGDTPLLNDTVMTGEDGSFEIVMPMVMPHDDEVVWMPRYWNIHAMASVTSVAGESHSAEITLPLSNRRTYMTTDLQDQVLADSVISVTYSRYNIAGVEIDGDVMLTLDGTPIAAAKANTPYHLASNIASGEHTLVAICGEDTLKNTFTAFRKSDPVPMKYTHSWFYQSADTWRSDNDEVWIQVGSCDEDVRMYYTLFSNDAVISQGSELISNQNITRTLPYKAEYGSGITFAVAWVKENKMYHSTMSIKRSLPDKSLKMEWVTFRDKLIPGQREQWTVRITHPSGTPANAVMQAVLYDKSLDALKKHTWRFTDPRRWAVPYTRWNALSWYNNTMRMLQESSNLDEKALQFSRLCATYNMPLVGRRMYGHAELLSAAPAMGKTTRSVMMSKSMARGETVETMDVNDVAEAALSQVEDDATDEEAMAVRSDFAETAFFIPAVRTDAKGIATMRFTLPESTTTWRFMALSHDDTMNNGELQAEAVAQKVLMVQPNMPRFVRHGDKVSITVTVSNMLSQSTNTTIRLSILDASTEKVVHNAMRKTTIKGNATAAVAFDIDAAALPEGDYICRVTAQGGQYTDGEQHQMVVLSDEEVITMARAYTFVAPTDTLLSFADLIPQDVEKAHLRVEYVDNPAWLMMETLPEMMSPDTKNAITLASALYANRVSASLKWEASQSDDVLQRLRSLQKSDGGFAWYDGMESSMYITSSVVKTLTRLNKLCGNQTDTKDMLDKAFVFMQQKVDADVARMKERQGDRSAYVSRTHLDWLYSLTLEGRDGGSSADYLIKHLVAETKNDDIATKAMAAIVLHNNGKKGDARTFVESILEHTVYRQDVGRYFDSYRAAYSWCDYRIPTQVMAIEALEAVSPSSKREVSDMRRWLLSSKRTQQWSNAVNTVNAVHAFLGNSMKSLTVYKGKETLTDSDVTPTQAVQQIKKTTDVESWAAAYVTFKQRSADISTDTMGLSVRRELLLNGRTVDEDALKVGDRVTVRLIITADRDYDFVTVTDNRAACLEPVRQLAGFSDGAYRETLDTKTMYHYNKLSKGTHTLQTEYFVDRTGQYSAGTATAVCEYADEFRGTASSYKLMIQK